MAAVSNPQSLISQQSCGIIWIISRPPYCLGIGTSCPPSWQRSCSIQWFIISTCILPGHWNLQSPQLAAKLQYSVVYHIDLHIAWALEPPVPLVGSEAAVFSGFIPSTCIVWQYYSSHPYIVAVLDPHHPPQSESNPLAPSSRIFPQLPYSGIEPPTFCPRIIPLYSSIIPATPYFVV